ncbi:uncharacterized protein C3orf38 homolog [Chanos chanos]|uniref:Uncharacterized protein C3orf38 homolog n=1 Tax=Chanos chanos TaxID=29144 RepID=A0A6J2WCM2_CHACN|nr:uncharacterized protein C3orf38 homolog [Chanos chanos]
MPKLTDRERDGCRKLLELLPETDLLSLSDTVTNRMISVENPREAIEAIVTYSENAEELLKRKKVHRDVIFKYLAKEGVVITPSSEKHQLIKRTLELWSSHVSHVSISAPVSTGQRAVYAGDGLSDLTALSQQFCHWFYSLLNSHNPLMGQPMQDWGPQHFWETVRLRIGFLDIEQKMEEFHGAEMVSMRLKALAEEEQLLFNPNMEGQGLKCISSPHGLVLVAVAGTIYRHNNCLGIFEQVFGLIRSPLTNNSWKIKFVDLKITGQNAIQAAQRSGPPALTFDSSELLSLYS